MPIPILDQVIYQALRDVIIQGSWAELVIHIEHAKGVQNGAKFGSVVFGLSPPR